MSIYPEEVGAESCWPIEATRRMNQMYRRQRHIYDGTRRYYLLGRDRLIEILRELAEYVKQESKVGMGVNDKVK